MLEVWEEDSAMQGGDAMNKRGYAQIILLIVAIIMTFYPAFDISWRISSMKLV